MNEEFKQFSAPWIKKLRLQLGCTQEQFAHTIGTSTITISRWERGMKYPSMRFQGKLLDLSKGPPEKRAPTVAGQFLFDPTIPFHSGLPTKGLIGREALFERSKRWLQSHTGTFVLQGAYGAGKTSLTVALALDKEVQAFWSASQRYWSFEPLGRSAWYPFTRNVQGDIVCGLEKALPGQNYRPTSAAGHRRYLGCGAGSSSLDWRLAMCLFDDNSSRKTA
jgi:transcriptional regulator with XRE-family HTH domain